MWSIRRRFTGRNRFFAEAGPVVQEMFDREHYLEANPDVPTGRMDPLAHYVRYGMVEGRSPSPLFDTAWYMAAHPYLFSTRTDPAEHYLRFGGFEGHNPHPLFESAWYLSKNDDIPEGINPLVHFQSVGSAEFRAPHPLFDARWYVSHHGLGLLSSLDAVKHYLREGARVGLDPHPLFDSSWYLERNPDVESQEVNPLVHFLEIGWREGRDPNKYFDTTWYAETNRDIAQAGLNPLIHFATVGEAEGRNPSTRFNAAAYVEEHLRGSQDPDADPLPLTHYLTRGRALGLRVRVLYATALPKSPLLLSQPRWAPCVVILSRIDIPQCVRYRIRQKLELGEITGLPVVWFDFRDLVSGMTAVQLASVLVLYRLPHDANLEAVVEEARRLRVPVVYETDDLVYRREHVVASPNLSTLPRKLQEDVARGADLSLKALRLADHVLASTEPLAEDMKREVVGQRFVIDNGIDRELRQVAAALVEERARGELRRRRDGAFVVSYGSGSRAHDADLAVAAPAIARFMSDEPRVRLDLIGPLRLPVELRPFKDRIYRVEDLVLPEYLRRLASADVAIAPLVDDKFNRFKSQVKYLEAAMLNVPFIASPTVYGDYVDHGRTGLLAADESEWFTCLRRAVEDSGLRESLATAAHEDVGRWELRRTQATQFRDFTTRVLEIGVPG